MMALELCSLLHKQPQMQLFLEESLTHKHGCQYLKDCLLSLSFLMRKVDILRLFSITHFHIFLLHLLLDLILPVHFSLKYLY